MSARVLIVAGSDSGGGAGIQADIKTVTALGGYAATAVTALTAQNTLGVFGVLPVPPEFIVQQMRVVLEDIGCDALKTGMLHDAAVIEAVADTIVDAAAGRPLVVDPVMVAKGGDRLLAADAVIILRRRLLPLATVLTPNLPEAAALLERPVRTVEDQLEAARELRSVGPQSVLVKGGRAAADVITDVLATAQGEEVFRYRRQPGDNTHGTGCTLASAIATGIARGLEPRDAVAQALDYVQAAMRTAPGLGRGHGPLDHGHTLRVTTGI